MPRFAPQPNPQSYQSSGGRVVTTDGRTLPLLSAHLRASAEGGVARVTLSQTFQNPYAEPLHVTYQMPLPADGAVSGYAFQLGERRIVGEVDGRAKARQRFEDAILEGRTAGLVDQERSSLFTQELGNLPPGVTLVAELVVDQKLGWLAEGAWEWRFPTVVAPRYLGAAGSVADADKVTVDVADGPLTTRVSLELDIRDLLVDGARPESPSHPLAVDREGGALQIRLADETARLDRDVVVRWAAAGREPGLKLQVARPAAGKPHGASGYGLLTLTPPSPRFEPEAQPRDLIVLLDTSGSMSGEPLDQARRVVSAMVDSLTEHDRLEMIEFSSSPRRWKSKPVEGSVKNRRAALDWLKALRASGGTEMRTGILEALAPLRPGAQRQVVLITDGLIGGESEVLREIVQRLPQGCRVHTVGVGSGVNRSLTQPAARAGRGVELIIGLGEDPERAAQRIVSRTCAPLITGLTISGSAVEGVSPRLLPDVFKGAPLLASLRLRAEGGELVVSGETAEGRYQQRLTVEPLRPASGSAAVCALYARETVEDCELRLAAGEPRAEVEPEIEQLGVTFQISTRLTSWIAISEEPTVDQTAPTRKENIPQELPYGMSAEGIGLRPRAFAVGGAPGAGPMTQASEAPLRSAVMRPRAGAPDKAKRERAPEKKLAPPRDLGAAPPPPPAPYLDEGRKESAEAEVEESYAEPQPQPQPQAAQAWAGRILRQTATELLLEVILPADTRWPAEGTAEVTLADGRTVRVQVDALRTTRPGALMGGLGVRLALTFPEGLLGSGAPQRVAFGAITIAL